MTISPHTLNSLYRQHHKRTYAALKVEVAKEFQIHGKKERVFLFFFILSAETEQEFSYRANLKNIKARYPIYRAVAKFYSYAEWAFKIKSICNSGIFSELTEEDLSGFSIFWGVDITQTLKEK